MSVVLESRVKVLVLVLVLVDVRVEVNVWAGRVERSVVVREVELFVLLAFFNMR